MNDIIDIIDKIRKMEKEAEEKWVLADGEIKLFHQGRASAFSDIIYLLRNLSTQEMGSG